MTAITDSWAESLTTDRLAQDLRALAENIRSAGDAEQRNSLLREAARRLEPSPVHSKVRSFGVLANADGSLFLTLDGKRHLIDIGMVNKLLTYLLRFATVEIKGDGTVG